MPRSIDVYLEIGNRRVFAGAIEHPGWCRSAKDPEAAIEVLASYAERYARAVKRPANEFRGSPKIVERLRGDATTDFGAPGMAPKADARKLDAAELERQARVLEACWAAFDAAARKAVGATLSKGPRGGGRELDAIVAHVFEADGAYVARLGGGYRPPKGATPAKEMAKLRKAFLETLASRAAGELPAPSRSTRPPWTPRYAVRRSAWHALDHAWEIEDRAERRQTRKAPG